MSKIFKLNNEYKQWLLDLKQRIRQSQLKAAVKVNMELIIKQRLKAGISGYKRLFKKEFRINQAVVSVL